MNRATLRWAGWIALGAIALSLALGTGSVPLLDPDESRFARTSVEMLRSGDLVVPRFQGEPRLVKPPLVHWIQSFVFRWSGLTERAARVHALLATLASAALLAWILRRRYGPEAAVWAVVVFGSMPLAVVPGRLGTLDALLAVHIFAAVALDLAGPAEGKSYRGLAFGGLLGLAFLAKGPVGLVLPPLVVLAGRTATARPLLPSVPAFLQAVAACSVVVLPWVLAFVRRVGLEAALATVRGESLERYFGGTVHVEPVWYYAKVIAVGLLPWQGPLLLGLLRVFRQRRDAASGTALYAAAGLVAGVIFFTAGRGKLPTYLLPLVPLVAILLTWELGKEIEEASERRTGSYLLAGSIAGLAILLASVAFRLDGPARVAAVWGAAAYAIGALVAAGGVVARRPRWSWGAAAASSWVFLMATFALVHPAIAGTRSSVGLIEAVPELRSERPLVTVDMKVPSLTLYLDRRVEVVPVTELELRVAAPDRPLLVFDVVDIPALPAGLPRRLRQVGGSGKYVVYEERETASP